MREEPGKLFSHLMGFCQIAQTLISAGKIGIDRGIAWLKPSSDFKVFDGLAIALFEDVYPTQRDLGG